MLSCLFIVALCLERADLLALVCDFYYVFVTFPCGILGQVWYLIISFPFLLYFDTGLENSTRPLVFTSASGCRASKIFDISSEN